MFKFFKIRKLKRLLKKASLMYGHRLNNPVSDTVLAREISLYKKIAALYDALKYSPTYPFGREQALQSYRMAADLGDVESMRIMGQRLLEQGKFWLSYADTIFENKVHALYASRSFESAFAFLNSATKQHDPQAMRMLGMMYINGWGIEADVDKGIKLIVDSIEIEGAWQRSTEIFNELGLMSQPEFFTKLMAIKSNSQSISKETQ